MGQLGKLPELHHGIQIIQIIGMGFPGFSQDPEQRLPVPTGVSELQRLLREVNKVNCFNADRWNLGDRLKEAVVSRV